MTLKTRFTRVAHGSLMGTNRYVLITSAGKSTLIDSSTGLRIKVSRPGCSPNKIGGSWIVFACDQNDAGPSLELYSIITRHFQALTVSPSVYNVFGPASCLAVEPPTLQCAGLTAVGTDWIAFHPECITEHCGSDSQYVFQNLMTGTTEAKAFGSTASSMTINLDFAELTQSLCDGVTTPPGGFEDVPASSVTVDGRFAVATTLSDSDPGPGLYLERCGTRLHERLSNDIVDVASAHYPSCWAGTCLPPMTAHAIVWQPLFHGHNNLGGMFLPSRQRFTILHPTKIGPLHSLVLTPHTLYLASADSSGSTVWSTPVPIKPPRTKSNPR